MMRRTLKCKLLAGILCASMVLQSVSVSAFAEEVVSEVQEESLDDSVTESEGTETENVSVSEESAMVSEDSIETPAEQPAEEAWEATKDENTEEDAIVGEEERQFEDVDIAFYGFRALVRSAKLKCLDDDQNYDFYLKEYKGDELIGTYNFGLVDTENGHYTISNDYAYLGEGVDNVVLEAKIEKDGISKVFSTTPITRANQVTDLKFSVNDLSTGAGSLELNLSYSGDLKLKSDDNLYTEVILYYGTDADESTWKRQYYANILFSNQVKNQNIVFTDLPVNMALHGKIEVRIGELYDSQSGDYKYAYNTELPLEDFTTKGDVEYKCTEVFPDEVLRQEILSQVDVTGDTIKQSQLEKITSLRVIRKSVSTVAIKDLTGIDLLINVTNLHIITQEISDVTKINWGNLTRLRHLDLSANNLTIIPDLTKNTNLGGVYFGQNLLTQSECSNILEKLPPNYKGNFDIGNQRTDGLGIVVDPTYYYYGEKSPVAVEVTGYKTGLDYSLKFYVDGNEMQFDQDDYWPNIFGNIYAGLSFGKHTIKAELWADKKISETSAVEFTIAQLDGFVTKKEYCLPTKSKYI